MNVTPAIDVAHLPLDNYGKKDPLWWGVMGLIIVESMGFALLIALYFYLRMRYAEWPPANVGLPRLDYPTGNLFLIIAVTCPMWLIQREAAERSRFWLAGMLGISAVMLAGTCVLRIIEFQMLGTDWQTYSYGSITWALLFMHAIHLFTSLGEAIMLGVYALTSELDRKHRADLQINSVYWYFVVISWIVVYAVLYLVPRVL
jgi:heme/copper-type cytochrome/quinol oxidase subunit 3